MLLSCFLSPKPMLVQLLSASKITMHEAYVVIYNVKPVGWMMCFLLTTLVLLRIIKIFKGLRPDLEGFVVTMHEGACETGSQIPKPFGRGIWRTVRTSPTPIELTNLVLVCCLLETINAIYVNKYITRGLFIFGCEYRLNLHNQVYNCLQYLISSCTYMPLLVTPLRWPGMNTLRYIFSFRWNHYPGNNLRSVCYNMELGSMLFSTHYDLAYLLRNFINPKWFELLSSYTQTSESICEHV